jgi:hypothetical protein
MGAVNALAPGQSLKLFATFRPEPLFTVMAAKGFGYEATRLDDGDSEVMFVPNGQSAGGPTSRPEDPDSWPDPIHYLDCTEMDPPEPMVQILAKLESMSEGEVMFALLGREPVFLFPELQARGHAWAGDFDAEGTAYRLMVRAGSKS